MNKQLALELVDIIEHDSETLKWELDMHFWHNNKKAWQEISKERDEIKYFELRDAHYNSEVRHNCGTTLCYAGGIYLHFHPAADPISINDNAAEFTEGELHLSSEMSGLLFNLEEWEAEPREMYDDGNVWNALRLQINLMDDDA